MSADGKTATCLHFSGIMPSRCMVGRTAPRDCAVGCAAYEADMINAMSLDRDKRTRAQVWARIVGPAESQP